MVTPFTGRCRVAALSLAVALIAGCKASGGETGGGGGPMLRTIADSIAFGRDLVIKHGCGDCHGGGDNPGAPMWLVGFRPGTDDTLFWPAKIPTPGGMMNTYPRNLTPDSETGLGRFTDRQIYNALKFGLRPGETPDVVVTSTTPGQGNFPATPKYLAPPMPWPAWRHMSDAELWSIVAYLKRGVKPQSNKNTDSDGPPDFWAGLYAQIIGPATPPAFPTDREVAPSR
jgi:hypothetical protein